MKFCPWFPPVYNGMSNVYKGMCGNFLGSVDSKKNKKELDSIYFRNQVFYILSDIYQSRRKKIFFAKEKTCAKFH